MLECKNEVASKLPPKERKAFTYTQLGRAALGGFGKWMVDLSVLGCNLGVCAGYMIFISSNLRVSGNYKITHTFYMYMYDHNYFSEDTMMSLFVHVLE